MDLSERRAKMQSVKANCLKLVDALKETIRATDTESTAGNSVNWAEVLAELRRIKEAINPGGEEEASVTRNAAEKK